MLFMKKTSMKSIMESIEKQLAKLEDHRTNLQLEAVELEERIMTLQGKQEALLQEDADAQRVSNNLSKILYGQV